MSSDFRGIDFEAVPRSEMLSKAQATVEKTRTELVQLAELTEAPSFANTVGALERSLEPLRRSFSLFFNLHSADSDDTLKAQAADFSRLATEFNSSLYFNKKLFARVKSLYDVLDQFEGEERALILHHYLEFERGGALLSEDDQKALNEIDLKLGQASVTFRQNVLESMNQFKLWIEKEEDLAGLPQDFISTIKKLAQEHGRPEAWLVTLHPPFYMPFMTYSSRRELREKLFRAHASKGLEAPLDNRGICYEMAELRKKRAQLLGFSTYAEMQLEQRMAKTPGAVLDLLNQLLTKALPLARQELKSLLAVAGSEIEGPFRSWDYNYYEEKLKNQQLNLSEEDIKPYFECQRTLEGFLDLAARLYSMSWKKVENAQTYHKDVDLYAFTTKEGGELVGYLYVDLFSRPSKSGGAWMTTFLQQGTEQLEGRPVVSIVCNFTPASPEQPSLLTFDEALTLFHEGGHALHELLSSCKYSGLSGTNTYLDFVELPSQFMENWLYESEVLQPWARHYKTGEVIPKKYLDTLKGMKRFLAGLQTVRQLGFGYLDLAWHHNFSESTVRDIFEFEEEALESTRIFPKVQGTSLSASFAHLFAGGYAAGYYGYKWAEVLDADAFSAFKEEGLFNPVVGERFRREILARGGTADPAELFKNFRGREPSPEPLMVRSGFLEAST